MGQEREYRNHDSTHLIFKCIHATQTKEAVPKFAPKMVIKLNVLAKKDMYWRKMERNARNVSEFQ